VLASWADSFVTSRPMRTLELLTNMNAALKPDIVYAERHEPGTQLPAETLENKAGACRDFAMVFIEAARYLGFGARFVSGYLYDPALDKGDDTQAVAATHAWAEVYLPGAGWIEYDPTDVLIAGENLIRVAVTRDPSQAIPIFRKLCRQSGGLSRDDRRSRCNRPDLMPRRALYTVTIFPSTR
jgi:transglutaminase-like putative cysteine protease